MWQSGEMDGNERISGNPAAVSLQRPCSLSKTRRMRKSADVNYPSSTDASSLNLSASSMFLGVMGADVRLA